MQDTIPQALTAPETARAHKCPLCGRRPGVPCQRKPQGDHLARYLDACTAGQLTREYMTAVPADLVVIARWRIVRSEATA